MGAAALSVLRAITFFELIWYNSNINTQGKACAKTGRYHQWDSLPEYRFNKTYCSLTRDASIETSVMRDVIPIAEYLTHIVLRANTENERTLPEVSLSSVSLRLQGYHQLVFYRVR